MVILPLDAWALVWLGMRLSLRARYVHHAMGLTLFCMFAIPWIVYIVVLGWLGMPNTMSTIKDLLGGASEEDVILGSWAAINIGNALLWLVASRTHLERRFRTLTTDPRRR